MWQFWSKKYLLYTKNRRADVFIFNMFVLRVWYCEIKPKALFENARKYEFSIPENFDLLSPLDTEMVTIILSMKGSFS